MTPTTDAAVEAAARALYEVDHSGYPLPSPFKWGYESEGYRNAYRRSARPAITAALPHLLAPIRELHERLDCQCSDCGPKAAVCVVCDDDGYPCQTIRICNELEGKTQ